MGWWTTMTWLMTTMQTSSMIWQARLSGTLRSTYPRGESSKVLRCYQKEIARLVHAQMQAHYHEEASGGYQAEISAGYIPLKPSAYTRVREDQIRDYRQAPEAGTRITRYVFGGFNRCLYHVEKFESEAERQVAVILERDSLKWFRPVPNQFFIYYRSGGTQHDYAPISWLRPPTPSTCWNLRQPMN